MDEWTEKYLARKEKVLGHMKLYRQLRDDRFKIILEALDVGYTNVEIMKVMGISTKTITDLRRENGISRKYTRRIKKAQVSGTVERDSHVTA